MAKVEDKSPKKILVWSLMEIGWRISIPLVVFVLLGVWLDNHFHTKPLFILLGIGFSLASTSYGIYKTIQRTFGK